MLWKLIKHVVHTRIWPSNDGAHVNVEGADDLQRSLPSLTILWFCIMGVTKIKVGYAGVWDNEALSPLWPFLLPDDATWLDDYLIQFNLVERFLENPTILLSK